MPSKLKNFICELCGSEFARKSLRAQFCSIVCRNKVLAKHKRWTTDEDNYLLSLIGRYQPSQILNRWNIEAQKRGWKDRSKISIQTRITDLCKVRGINSRATKDNWTGSDLARILDISRDRIKTWQLKGLIVERSDYEGDVYKGSIIITRKNLVAFAFARPDLFHSMFPSTKSPHGD